MLLPNETPFKAQELRTYVNQVINDTLDPNNFQIVKKALQSNAPTTRTAQQSASTAVQDYDLKVIDRFSDSEPLAFQSFAKIAEKVLNGGYVYASKDQDALLYVKQRLRDFSLISGLPTRIWIEQIVFDLIKYSNCFIYKYRDPEASNGSPINIDGKPVDPIASLMKLDATSVTPITDDKGNVKSYEIGPTDTNGGGGGGTKKKKVPPEDMFHIYAYRNSRNNLGTPFLWPVMDDIRVLRKMEENVEMLVHKHLFPLYHYIVGTTDYPAEPEEIEKVHYDLERLPTEGSLVTPERHTIKVVGAEGEAIDASKYLNYFQSRVLLGLGIGSVSFGVGGEGASKSTAETISRSLIEKAKYFQSVIKAFVEEQIISEILKEGGYEQYDVQNEVDVFLNFNEIDIDTQIKKENHYGLVFDNQGITYEEYRMALGRDAIPEGDEQEQRLQFNLFGPVVTTDLEIQADAAAAGAKAEIKSKDRPSNQHGQNLSPKRARDMKITDHKAHELDSTKEMSMRVRSLYDQARSDVISGIKSASSLIDAKDKVNFTLGITKSAMVSALNSFVNDGINKGYSSAYPGKIQDSLAVKESNAEFEHFIDKTITNVKNNVINILDNSSIDATDKPLRASAIFDLHNQYIKDASETIMTRAYNYGKALAFRNNGETIAAIQPNASACDACKSKAGILNLNQLTFDSVPPHHKDCNCEVDIYKVGHSNG
jgi:hypothetical protein